MEKILVSSCLLGNPVRYDGKDAWLAHPLLRQWQDEGRLVSICPEMAGGLPTPRPPAEILGGQGLKVFQDTAKVIDQQGNDLSAAFRQGAELALQLCRQQGIRLALLKSKSPSCGNETTYDGSFNHTLIDGQGVTAARLSQAGIQVFNEQQLERLALQLQKLETN